METAAVSVMTTREQCFTAGWYHNIFWSFYLFLLLLTAKLALRFRCCEHHVWFSSGRVVTLMLYLLAIWKNKICGWELNPYQPAWGHWSRMKVGQRFKRVKAFVKIISAGSFSCLRGTSGDERTDVRTRSLPASDGSFRLLIVWIFFSSGGFSCVKSHRQVD